MSFKHLISLVLVSSSLVSACNQDPVYVVEDPDIVDKEKKQSEQVGRLTTENEALKKENGLYEKQKQDSDALKASSVHKLIGTWFNANSKICFFKDQKSENFRYVVNEEPLSGDAQTTNESEQSILDTFAHGDISTMWVQKNMVIRTVDNLEIKGDRMMLQLNVKNGAKGSMVNFLVELDYSSKQNGFYMNLPTLNERFLSKPQSATEYFTSFNRNSDNELNSLGLFYEKQELPQLAEDRENPEDPVKLTELLLSRGESLCAF